MRMLIVQVHVNKNDLNYYTDPVGDEALVTAANNLEKEATQTIVELPDNLTGTSVTYDLMISESGAKIKKKDEKEKGRKRKNEESVAELQRLVLKEDLRRIREETELIILQKEKVALEILKLKLETSSLQTENEM
ncbi:uncharacterized protein LOC134271102 [Saccostrea cucullata]|uniref:uncharacterized protein LOC134271102 n=1 Tax=Saccostrea cuccullata TaxID=36930 RepID=UPI002ED5763C